MFKFFWIALALQTHEFPSIQINNFMSFCGTNVRMELIRSGWSDYMATVQAVQQCSCVLDKVRSSFAYQDFIALSAEEQKKESLKFALECAGADQSELT